MDAQGHEGWFPLPPRGAPPGALRWAKTSGYMLAGIHLFVGVGFGVDGPWFLLWLIPAAVIGLCTWKLTDRKLWAAVTLLVGASLETLGGLAATWLVVRGSVPRRIIGEDFLTILWVVILWPLLVVAAPTVVFVWRAMPLFLRPDYAGHGFEVLTPRIDDVSVTNRADGEAEDNDGLGSPEDAPLAEPAGASGAPDAVPPRGDLDSEF